MKNSNKILVVLLLILSFFSCFKKNKEKQIEKKGHLQIIKDTLYINKSLVMSIVLDSIKIDKLKEKYGEEFFTIMDDNAYYLYESEKYIESKKNSVFKVSQKVIGYFIDNQYVYYSVDAMKSPLNLLFYKKNKHPIEVIPIDVNLEFEKYYKN